MKRPPFSIFLRPILALVVGGLLFTAGRALERAELMEVREPALKILVVGDLMFDRQIRLVGEARGGDYLLACADPLLTSADLVVGNLEGTITAAPSVSAGSPIGSPANYQFTFPPPTADLLFKHNLKLVNLGNNHIGNFGWAGLDSTHDYLAQAGVNYFGGLAGDEPVYRLEQSGLTLSFISFNQFGGQEPEKVAAVIAAEKAAGRQVIVYAHWGEEYLPATLFQRQTAALFVASGAAIVIGSHPHVIQEAEVINGVPVYYSLGNFVFDQYWEPSVRTGLTLLIHLSKTGLEVEERLVELKRSGQTCPLPGQAYN